MHLHGYNPIEAIMVRKNNKKSLYSVTFLNFSGLAGFSGPFRGIPVVSNTIFSYFFKYIFTKRVHYYLRVLKKFID